MNLIYLCVFHNIDYLNLLELLVRSLAIKGNIDKSTTEVLIFTTPTFVDSIESKLSIFHIPILYHLLELDTLMEAGSARLFIFDYPEIEKYNKILYIDTDVLINSDINILFNLNIESDTIYALEEETISCSHHGSDFFDFTLIDKDTTAFTTGILFFIPSLSIRDLFNKIILHISTYITAYKTPPACLEQPFFIYNTITDKKYDNQLLKQFVENNPTKAVLDKIVYHFPGGPGNYSSKIRKMESFWSSFMNPSPDVIIDTVTQLSN
jgi:lipopolysaccharide biosynthesis glycosyltransferase